MLPQPVATADTHSPWDHESGIWSICWWTAAGPLQNSRKILDLSSAGWWFQRFHESCYPGSTIRTYERGDHQTTLVQLSYIYCAYEKGNLMYSLKDLTVVYNTQKYRVSGARGSVVVKALCYKPEGHGFDTRWGEFLNLPNHSGRTRPWGLLSL
jgi:hypothetical protein